MAHNVLTFTGHAAHYSSVHQLTLLEAKMESKIAKRVNFDKPIKEYLKDSTTLPSQEIQPLLS